MIKLSALWESPEHKRLAGAIDDFATELKHTDEYGRNQTWFLKADEHLKHARAYLADDNLQQGVGCAAVGAADILVG